MDEVKMGELQVVYRSALIVPELCTASFTGLHKVLTHLEPTSTLKSGGCAPVTCERVAKWVREPSLKKWDLRVLFIPTHTSVYYHHLFNFCCTDKTINHLNLIQYFAPVGPRRCLFFVTSDSFRSGVLRIVTTELLRRPSQGNTTMRVASPTVLRFSFSARNVYRRPPSQAGLPMVCRSRACIRTSLPAAFGFTVVSCR